MALNSYHSPLGFEKVLDYYEQSLIDYPRQYASLYRAYNAWYSTVTGATNDRQALNALKKRYGIWDDYQQGLVLARLTVYMQKIADLTQKQPLLVKGGHWTGELNNQNDWQSLIEYWYQVRCKVVHGAAIDTVYVWLAYETLDIFMQEIILRARARLKHFDVSALQKSRETFNFQESQSARIQEMQYKLLLKYSALPDIWQVDMQRVTPNSDEADITHE